MDDRVVVTVEDELRGASFRVDVDAAHALDAFHRPYSYANDGYDYGLAA